MEKLYEPPQSDPRFNHVRAQPPARSAMALTSLIMGIVAILMSALPIVNNVAALLAVLGFIFGIVGMVATGRKTRRGRGLAIAGVVLCVVSIVVVIATQNYYASTLDKALSGSQPTDNSAPSNDTGNSKTQDAPDFSNLTLGTAANLDQGLSVSADSVQTGLQNYDGKDITAVTVTYKNGGTKEVSFNMFDWKAQDSQGAQRSSTVFVKGKGDSLSSGSLAAGGTVTGTVYFEGTISKVLYYSSIFSHSTVGWTLA